MIAVFVACDPGLPTAGRNRRARQSTLRSRFYYEIKENNRSLRAGVWRKINCTQGIYGVPYKQMNSLISSYYHKMMFKCHSEDRQVAQYLP